MLQGLHDEAFDVSLKWVDAVVLLGMETKHVILGIGVKWME